MKEELYSQLLREVEALAEGCKWDISLLANVAAAVHERMHFWWTGFYMVRDGELQLGPFQGPVACTSIAKGRGVCGTAWAENRTVVVPDVEEFPGHIACSSASRSEIVVPVRRAGEVIGVLDIDSEKIATFDETDSQWLGRIVSVIENSIN